MNEHDTPIRRRRLLNAGQHQSLLDAYARHLAGTGLSPVSVHIHLGSTLHFLAWQNQSGIALEEVGPDIVARFAAHDCRCHSSPPDCGAEPEAFHLRKASRKPSMLPSSTLWKLPT